MSADRKGQLLYLFPKVEPGDYQQRSSDPSKDEVFLSLKQQVGQLIDDWRYNIEEPWLRRDWQLAVTQRDESARQRLRAAVIKGGKRASN